MRCVSFVVWCLLCDVCRSFFVVCCLWCVDCRWIMMLLESWLLLSFVLCCVWIDDCCWWRDRCQWLFVVRC